jgi:hypothetical protein
MMSKIIGEHFPTFCIGFTVMGLLFACLGTIYFLKTMKVLKQNNYTKWRDLHTLKLNGKEIFVAQNSFKE